MEKSIIGGTSRDVETGNRALGSPKTPDGVYVSISSYLRGETLLEFC